MSAWWWLVALAPLWGFALFIVFAATVMENEQRPGSSQDTQQEDA